METCISCRHAEEHHWWGLDPAPWHCDTCHRSWQSLTEGHCQDCCRHFADDESYTRHLGRNLLCLDPEAIREKGRKPFTCQETPFGGTWTLKPAHRHEPVPDEEPLPRDIVVALEKRQDETIERATKR